MQIQNDPTRGTDWGKAFRKEREILDIGMSNICQVLTSNIQPWSLICPMYITNTQLPCTLNQTLTRSDKLEKLRIEFQQFQSPGRQSNPDPLELLPYILPLVYRSITKIINKLSKLFCLAIIRLLQNIRYFFYIVLIDLVLQNIYPLRPPTFRFPY